MKILCVIPSRIGSTRLPRKPLLPIQGKPMIQWTYENASRCSLLSQVIVATDSLEIADCIHNIGGHAMMTDPHLPTGSERVASVAKEFRDMDIVINLQGDEPFIKPSMLETLVSPYLNGETPVMTTLGFPLDMNLKYHDKGAVKVILDQTGHAIYFSRSPIPCFRVPNESAPTYHHIGVYAFRYDFLMQYPTLSSTPLERSECLEQLRVIEHGHRIRVTLTNEKTLEINTKEEYDEAQSFQYVI